MGGLSKAMTLLAASMALGVAGLVVGAADDTKKADKKDEAPTLKKTKTKGLPPVGGYLGQKEIQEKLKVTAEERENISKAQKNHSAAEAKLYADYEAEIRKILGDDRWKQLAKLIDEKRDETAAKKKKTTKTDTKTETKTEPKSDVKVETKKTP